MLRNVAILMDFSETLCYSLQLDTIQHEFDWPKKHTQELSTFIKDLDSLNEYDQEPFGMTLMAIGFEELESLYEV